MDTKESNNILSNDLDGGVPEDSLHRILDGSVCTRHEMPTDVAFLSSLKDVVAALLGQRPKIECAVRAKYAGEESQVLNSIKSTQFIESQHQAEATKWKRASNSVLPSAIVSLLSNQYPVDLGIFFAFRKVAHDEQKKVSSAKRQENSLEISLENINAQAQQEIESSNKELEAMARDAVVSKLSNQVKAASANAAPSTSGGYMLETTDENLRGCLRAGLSIHEFDFSTENALDLLSRGIPFICVGPFTFSDGTQGRHASTVVGYAFNKTFSNNIEYFLRDSNFKHPISANLGCEKIITVY